MASQGKARAWILKCNDRPIAATLAFYDNSTYYSTQIVHDEAYSRSSPGTLLESIEMEHLIGEARFTTYDFLGGAPSNKRRWTETAMQTRRFCLVRGTSRGRIFRLYYFTIKPLAKRMGLFGSTKP